MTHRDIDVGDVVYDLAQQGTPKMQVVAKASQTVAGYREVEGFDLSTYKNHPHLPVLEGDTVYKCVYLADDPGGEPGGGTYDMPAGRLARAPVELVREGIAPIQHTLRVQTLERLFDAVNRSGNDQLAAKVSALVNDAFGAETEIEARELAEAARFGGDSDE